MLVFIIILISLTLLTVDISITFDLNVDILKNVYYVKLYLYGLSIMRIPIKLIKFDIKSRYLLLKIKHKIVGIAFTMDRENQDSILNYLASPIMKLIDIQYFNMETSIGKRGNALATALILQGVRIAVASAISYLKSSQNVIATEQYIPCYNDDVLRSKIFCIISLTPINIIFSVVDAIINKFKNKNFKGVNI